MSDTDAFVELEGQANHADARRRREELEALGSDELLAELERRGFITVDRVEARTWGGDTRQVATDVRRVGPPPPYTRPGNDQDPGPIGTAAEGDAAHALADRRHEGWAPRRLGMEQPATLADVDERLRRVERLLLGDGR